VAILRLLIFDWRVDKRHAHKRKRKMKSKIRNRTKSKSRRRSARWKRPSSIVWASACGPTLNLDRALNPLPNRNLPPNLTLLWRLVAGILRLSIFEQRVHKRLAHKRKTKSKIRKRTKSRRQSRL